MAIVNTMALQQPQADPGSVRRRWSLCPLVCPMARPAMKSRGPTRWPWATASRIPQSAPPVSRTVVNPRSSIARISPAARAVMSVSGTASSARRLTSERKTWAWQSISPGMSTRPPHSTTVAPAARMGRSETSRMRSPSTSTDAPSVYRPATVSSTRAFRNRTWLIRAFLPLPLPSRERAGVRVPSLQHDGNRGAGGSARGGAR